MMQEYGKQIRETSAGAVIFRRGERIFYLLLHYKYRTEYWDFPRGNVEEGETLVETAKREITEETGMKDFQVLQGFEEKTGWVYRREGNMVNKTTTYFLTETEEKDVTVSSEHLGYEWLEYEKAFDRLTFRNAKEVLKS